MIKKIQLFFLNSAKTETKESGISHFVHKTTSAKKKQVFKRVLEKATNDQRKVVYR
jgi:hypothetical protein